MYLMKNKREFHTEGTATLKLREAKDAWGSQEPTTDWCWGSVENVQGCGSA